MMKGFPRTAALLLVLASIGSGCCKLNPGDPNSETGIINPFSGFNLAGYLNPCVQAPSAALLPCLNAP